PGPGPLLLPLGQPHPTLGHEGLNPRRHSMSKLTRALALAAMLAAMNLAGMTAAAQAQATDHPTRQDARRPPTESRLAAQQQATADAAVQRLLARERPSTPWGYGNPAVQQALAQERSYSTSGYGDTPAPAPAAPGGQADPLRPTPRGRAPPPPRPPPAPGRRPTRPAPPRGALPPVMALFAGVASRPPRRATRTRRAS